jgi:hypothetical protein
MMALRMMAAWVACSGRNVTLTEGSGLESPSVNLRRGGKIVEEISYQWHDQFLYHKDQFVDFAGMNALATIGGKMSANPFLGLLFHWIGGLASASFYIPYRGVKKWAWETYWLVGGFFSWIIAPVLLAFFMTKDLFGVLSETLPSTLFWTYSFGVLWGIGGLTFGLTMRYLGISLGMAVALGFCAAFGTLIPPIFHGEFATKILGTNSGLVILLGVGVCLAGIAVSGFAGMTKEREMSEEQKRAVIKEFNFKKGILLATFSGVMSACFSYGLDAGKPIKALTLQHGTLLSVVQNREGKLSLLVAEGPSLCDWCGASGRETGKTGPYPEPGVQARELKSIFTRLS